MTERKLSRRRLVFFSLVTAAAVLGGANLLVDLLGEAGIVELHSPDDGVQFVDEALFERSADAWTTTEYAEQQMVPSRFARSKGERFRVFILGGSFAMGSPYVHQLHGGERPGGMSSFLRARLEVLLGQDRVEVINVGAGGEDSHRVMRVGEEVVRHDPDLLIVAMGNNEGTLPPSLVREHLHRLGGYRLLAGLLTPTPDISDRPTFTAQPAEAEQLDLNFAENLRRLAVFTEEAGVPLLLATLPVNLRYEGHAMSPFGPLGATEVESRERADECIVRGREAYQSGDHEGARQALRLCDDVAEAMRWIGLSLLAEDRIEAGRQALEQSLELLPRNRSRRSFEALVRARAASSEHVHLADLRDAADRRAPDGLAGPEVFIDYCHMNWRGYGLMADELLAAMRSGGLLPAGISPDIELPDLEAQAAALGLTEADLHPPSDE